MVKALACRIVVSEIDFPVTLLRSLLDKYPWKTYESPNLPSYGSNSTITVLLKGCIRHEITQGGWYAIKKPRIRKIRKLFLYDIDNILILSERQGKGKKKSRPYRPQHCLDWPEYRVESWRPEETCYHSNSREKPLAYTQVKNTHGV